MPWPFALLHVLLAIAAGAGSALIARSGPRAARALVAGIVLVAVPLQMALVRWPRVLAATGWSDVVFVADLWPVIAVALACAALVAAPTRGGRARAGLTAPVLLGLACAATTVPWRGASLRLSAPSVVDGVVLQTDEGSCAPAAAATLLRRTAIAPAATEAELARECLTHSRLGTSDLGLFRGLSRAAPGRRARFVEPGLDGLRALGRPAIVFVGLSAGRVTDPRLFEVLRARAGWTEGLSHAIVLLGLERGPGAVEVAVVADPGAGLERWPLEHFVALWDGTALVLDR